MSFNSHHYNFIKIPGFIIILLLWANIFSSCTYNQKEVAPKDNCSSSELSFQNQIKPIIQNNCAVSGCHNGGNSLPDYNQFNQIKDRANLIKQRTQNGEMPPPNSGLSLTDQQITDIECWVDQGAKNN